MKNNTNPTTTGNFPSHHSKPATHRPPDSWGVHVTRAACSTPQGRVSTINQSFVITNGAARLSRRWSPGLPFGDFEPDAMAALRANAEAHAEAYAQGKPTADRPAGESWRDRRAA